MKNRAQAGTVRVDLKGIAASGANVMQNKQKRVTSDMRALIACYWPHKLELGTALVHGCSLFP